MSRWFFAIFSVVLASGCAAGAVDQQDIVNAESTQDSLKVDCSYVKCAYPVCDEGQRLQLNNGSCCPTCVGKPSNDKCATVLCAAVECGENEVRVFSNGDCCGRCVQKPEQKECSSDMDCPVYYCIACPCPVSECRGNKCVTTTPSPSTCGGSTF